jgi:hypothetical protein
MLSGGPSFAAQVRFRNAGGERATGCWRSGLADAFASGASTAYKYDLFIALRIAALP